MPEKPRAPLSSAGARSDRLCSRARPSASQHSPRLGSSGSSFRNRRLRAVTPSSASFLRFAATHAAPTRGVRCLEGPGGHWVGGPGCGGAGGLVSSSRLPRAASSFLPAIPAPPGQAVPSRVPGLWDRPAGRCCRPSGLHAHRTRPLRACAVPFEAADPRPWHGPHAQLQVPGSPGGPGGAPPSAHLPQDPGA